MVQAKQGTIKVNLLPFEFLKTTYENNVLDRRNRFKFNCYLLNLPDLMENNLVGCPLRW